jgi:hypothetical protein
MEILTFKKIYDFYEINTKSFGEGYLIILKTMSIHQNSLFDAL